MNATRSIGIAGFVLLLVLVPRAGVLGGEGASDDPVPVPAGSLDSFEPSPVRLECKGITVSELLRKIERQTGNRIVPSVSHPFKDVVLHSFSAKDEPYWIVVDRLCKASGNRTVWKWNDETKKIDLTIRNGPMPAYPAAYGGPFKACATAVHRKEDFSTGELSAGFEFFIMIEPKWRMFQYRGPVLREARCDTGAAWGARPLAGLSWYCNLWCYIDCDDPDKVRLSHVPKRSREFTDLAVDLEVRITKSWEACRFQGVVPGMAPASRKAGSRTVTVQSLEIDGDHVSLEAELEGMEPSNAKYSRFVLFRGLERLGTLTHSFGTAFNGRVKDAKKLEEPFDLVAVMPGKQETRRIRFKVK